MNLACLTWCCCMPVGWLTDAVKSGSDMILHPKPKDPRGRAGVLATGWSHRGMEPFQMGVPGPRNAPTHTSLAALC